MCPQFSSNAKKTIIKLTNYIFSLNSYPLLTNLFYFPFFNKRPFVLVFFVVMIQMAKLYKPIFLSYNAISKDHNESFTCIWTHPPLEE